MEDPPADYHRRQAEQRNHNWIRGVNIGGWLLLERFITPSLFALTDCHIQGNFCWYPGQLSAPPTTLDDHEYCDLYQCKPLYNKDLSARNLLDSLSSAAATSPSSATFPVDEYTLAMAFYNKNDDNDDDNDDIKTNKRNVNSKFLAERYLGYHFDNFIKKEDVQKLKEAHVTHVRVPVPHWILGDDDTLEPWMIDGGRWMYFIRFVGWCHEVGIQVWIDIHTAPGSQNGFDNSGHLLDDAPTCTHWSSSKRNVQQSLDAVKNIASAIMRDSLRDVVTGFGILNEPFMDCDRDVVISFYNDALNSVRTIMGSDTAVYIGDMFNATKWNNGWWTDEESFSNTYLDSHSYHVFDARDRALTPKQHIALVCGKDTRETQSCCYQDFPHNTKPSKGISRLIGEWSASFDILPAYKLAEIMKGIAKHGESPEWNRTMSDKRRKFLERFVQAQMVAYESVNSGVSKGWFYWTIKMEGGAFAEWDFLRGVREGWIPTLPGATESAESLYGTCMEIAEMTDDDVSIVDEFPDPDTTPGLWLGPMIDDDYVLSLTENSHDKVQSASNKNQKAQEPKLIKEDTDELPPSKKAKTKTVSKSGIQSWFPLVFLAFFGYGIWRVFFKDDTIRSLESLRLLRPNRAQYTNLDAPTILHV